MPKINTYTDNASIENDDKLLTYDTQAAATKLTAFSTIWSWIQSKFNALTKQTGITSADQLLMVKTGNTTGRIDYNVLAKAILEEYAASTLAGSAQSVKAALDSLNSNHKVITKILHDGTEASTREMSVKASARYLVIHTSSNIDRSGIFLIISFSNGQCFVQDVSKGSKISCISGTRKVTFQTNGVGGCDVSIFSVDGSSVNETLTNVS